MERGRERPLDATNELVDGGLDGATVGHHGLDTLRDEVEHVVLLLTALTVRHVGTVAGHATNDLDLEKGEEKVREEGWEVGERKGR